MRLHQILMALTSPAEVPWVYRVGWLFLAAIVIVFLALLIGQTLTRGQRAFYPGERLRIAAAGGLIVYALAIVVTIGASWYRNGPAPWRALSAHAAYVAACLFVALLCVPTKPASIS